MMSVKITTKQLSLWFKENARDLPWRRNPEPYFVWLSEIMLQQTQVAAVIPYFERFTKKFPTVHQLAQASLDEVYSLWAGLGYYSRARNLHRGAMAISQRLKSKKGFPRTRAEWLEIPGVGEYTAGAVTSIALNQAEPIVDGNVVRVLARYYGIRKLDSKKTEIWGKAKQWVTARGVEPRVLNQALMELGAMICRPKTPSCSLCPIQNHCLGKNTPLEFPEPKAKKIWKAVEEQKWVLVSSDAEGNAKIFLQQNESGRWREGLWDFPNAGSIPKMTRGKLASEFLLNYVVTRHKVSRKHSVFQLSPSVMSHIKNGKWCLLSELPAVPSPVLKAVRRVTEAVFPANQSS